MSQSDAKRADKMAKTLQFSDVQVTQTHVQVTQPHVQVTQPRVSSPIAAKGGDIVPYIFDDHGSSGHSIVSLRSKPQSEGRPVQRAGLSGRVPTARFCSVRGRASFNDVIALSVIAAYV